MHRRIPLAHRQPDDPSKCRTRAVLVLGSLQKPICARPKPSDDGGVAALSEEHGEFRGTIRWGRGAHGHISSSRRSVRASEPGQAGFAAGTPMTSRPVSPAWQVICLRPSSCGTPLSETLCPAAFCADGSPCGEQSRGPPDRLLNLSYQSSRRTSDHSPARVHHYNKLRK